MKKFEIIKNEIIFKNCKIRKTKYGFYALNDKRTKAYKQYMNFRKEITEKYKKQYEIYQKWTEKIEYNKATFCIYVTKK